MFNNRNGKHMPTKDELNALFAHPNRKVFQPCKKDGCVDGWVVVDPNAKYVKVTRCKCFENYQRGAT